jgi:alpha-1,2-mannosyltransferase
MKTPTRGHSSILQAVSFLLAGGLAVFLTLQALDATCLGDGNDLDSYLESARALKQGDDPYATGSPFPYIYPLFLALVITPLVTLPCQVASLIWSLLGWAALVGTVLIIRRHLWSPLPVVWLAGLCLVTFDVIQNNVVNGQVNLLVLFLCYLGFHLDRRNRHLPAALALGAAAAIKLTPLVLLGFLLVRRRWSTVGSTILVFLALCLAPGLLPGVEVRVLYGSYIRDFLAESLADKESTVGHAVFSFVGIMRLTGLPLNSLGSLILLVLVPGVFLVWDTRSLSTREISGQGYHDLRSFSLYLLIPLFVVPMSEVHHLIFAFPSFLFLVATAKFSADRRVWTLLAAALLLYVAGSFFWREGPLYFLSLILLFWAIVSDFPGQDQKRAFGE